MSNDASLLFQQRWLVLLFDAPIEELVDKRRLTNSLGPSDQQPRDFHGLR